MTRGVVGQGGYSVAVYVVKLAWDWSGIWREVVGTHVHWRVRKVLHRKLAYCVQVRMQNEGIAAGAIMGICAYII